MSDERTSDLVVSGADWGVVLARDGNVDGLAGLGRGADGGPRTCGINVQDVEG